MNSVAFESVKRDNKLDNLVTYRRLRVPQYNTLPVTESSQEANIVFNRSDKIFYGYNGNNWVQLSSATASTGDGFQATDSSGTIIDDNVVAGIVTDQLAVAAGYNAKATAPESISIGAGSLASSQGAVALGYTSRSTGNTAVAIGINSRAQNTNALALGYNTNASGENSLAISTQARSAGSESTAIGSTSYAQGDRSTAIGYQAYTSVADAIALGNSASAGQSAVIGTPQLGLPANFMAPGIATGPNNVIEVNLNGTIKYIQLYNNPT